MTIDLALITRTTPGGPVFSASSSNDFDRIVVAGDAERLPRARGLRLRITGIDPQLILPAIAAAPASQPLTVHAHLKVQSE